MSAKRQRLRAASCLGKTTYRSRQEALEAVNRYEERVVLMDHILQAYQCRFGNHWHFGHNRRGTTPRVMISEFVRECRGAA